MLRRGIVVGIALLLALGSVALLLQSEEVTPFPSGETPTPAAPRAKQAPRVSFSANPSSPSDLPSEEGGADPSAGDDASPPQAAKGKEQERGTDLPPIRGRVVDAKEDPICGATIREIRATGGASGRDRQFATSDAQGQFTLQRLLPGGSLSVSAAGFLPRELPVGSRPGHLMIELVKAKHISVTVVEAESGLPIEKAQVLVKAGSKHTARTTSKTGQLELTVGTRSVTLEVWIKERVSQVWHEGDHPLIALERGRAVHGQVVLPSGAGVQRAPVVVVGRGQRRWPQCTQTGPEGFFELPGGIAPGERLAVFSWDPRHATPLRYDWLPAGSDNVRVQLEPRGDLVLHGQGGPQGSPLRPVPSLDRLAGANQTDFQAWNGHARFTALAAGTYQMRDARGDRFGGSFEIEPGQDLLVEWKPGPGQAPRARGKRPGRSAPSGSEEGPAPKPAPPAIVLRALVSPSQPVEVSVRRGPRRLRRLQAPDGSFSLKGLAPGSYTLEIKRRDGQAFLLDVTLPQEEELKIPLSD